MSTPATIARAECAVGEVALRSRGPHTELIVNGAFVMDTVDVSTEVALATHALERHLDPRRVLVGGLGLGFTARAVLDDPRVEQATIVEIASPLIEWAGAGMLPAAGLDDERLTLRAGDVAEVLAQTLGEWDLILLDVDNGPGFLVRDANAALYAEAGLAAAARALRRGGILAIWSSHRSPELLAALEVLASAQSPSAVDSGTVEEVIHPIEREGRAFEYAIYLLVM